MAKILVLLIVFLFLVAMEASSFEVYHYTQRDGVPCFTVDPIGAFRELAKQYYELGKMEEHKQRILKERK
ncbi:MAG: hypothetical protein QHH30_10150 [candidate division NC10 bacterium]|nr:hypothetical protein [candidate division NC10 bacterium]